MNRSFETLLERLLSLLTRPINNIGKKCIIRDFIFYITEFDIYLIYLFYFSFFFSADAASSPTGEISLLLLVVVFQVVSWNL